MEKVSWNNGCYLFGGKPGFLVSGEFHYFRVPRQDWKKRLRLFREAGGNCVATYVPWILHEPTEGNYRFGGAPWLELEAFLSLCCEEGLYVLCRPGPYQYSEMRYDGLPAWLCENYPELLARDIRGNIFRKSSVSYLHPLFLQKTREWFSHVCPILAKYTVSKGGSIAFAQFDNELMGIQEWFGTLDYHPVTMGFGSETGRYARFLKKRYGTAGEMAEAYGQSWSSFAQAVPFDGEARTDDERRRMTDYQDFYYACTAEYASLLTKWMREYGIDCPFVHNSGGPDMNAEFIETADALGGDFLLGSDHYYNLDMDWNQNNPTPQYAVKVMSSCGQLRALGYPPTVMEMPGGSCSEWPPITPTDLKSCYMTNLAVGMKGLNYYIFTGGVNPDGIGNNGDSYDYGASVGAKGEIRPSYAVQKEFGLMLRGNPWLAQAEQCGDFALGFSWADARGKSLPQPRREEGPGGWETWKFLLRGPAISSLCASFSPELVDRGADDLSARCAGKPLVVASSACMAQKEQRRLADFVAGGGKLLLLPVIPGLDECFRPCTVLRELIGDAHAERCLQESPRVNVGEIKNVMANEALWVMRDAPAGAEIFAAEENTGAAVGWEKRFPGGGSILWLGMQWKHAKNEHGRMMRALLLRMGCTQPVVSCDNPNVWAFLRSDGHRSALFLLNLFTERMEAGVSVRRADGSPLDLGRQAVDPMQVKMIFLDEEK